MIQLDKHNGIYVARDDLYEGGTKARAAEFMFGFHQEIVYAGAAQSYAQVALAYAAKKCGRKGTVFTSARAEHSQETAHALAVGIDLHEVRPGYLSVATARAAAYCAETGAWLAPLGFDVPEVRRYLADVAQGLAIMPDEVWVAAGSGTLTRALQRAWPHARHHAVLFGKEGSDVGFATAHRHPMPYGKATKSIAPFPSHPTFDAKAWEVCAATEHTGITLFWNVAA